MKRPKNLDRLEPDDIELPQSAQLIADVIGREATLKLARAARNQKIYIPSTLCAGHASISRRSVSVTRRTCTCKGHWISETVGDALAVKLVNHFSGEHLDLACCYYIHAVQRNKRIREQHKAGATKLDLMREHKLSERAIRYIIQGHNGRRQRPLKPAPRTQKPSPSTHNPLVSNTSE